MSRIKAYALKLQKKTKLKKTTSDYNMIMLLSLRDGVVIEVRIRIRPGYKYDTQ
ncbi:MAG: hypothetical protein WBW34_07950 [Nitrososphaeraceae archaeon]